MQLSYFHQADTRQKKRNLLLGHNSFVIWFTGLSGSGKSTLANLLDEEFYNRQLLSYVLDGDDLRNGLNIDLDFSTEGRKENVRRTAEVSKLMLDAGVIVITSLISPIDKDRESARKLLNSEKFLLVYLDCELEICESRDPKGFYKRAREGTIKNYTGIDSVYEIPSNPDVIVQTNKKSPFECINEILLAIKQRKWING